MIRAVLVALILAGPPVDSIVQTAADSAGIRRAALDYIEGWYEADAARMERAVHPRLAKRLVRHRSGEIAETDGPGLVAATRAREPTSPAERRAEVEILDVYENAASVKVTASDWVDYMHLGRVDGEWRILNVLSELSPDAKRQAEERRQQRRPSE